MMLINELKGANPFQHEALALMSRLVASSGLAFFLVNPNMQHSNALLYNLTPDIEKDYRAEYGALDPLNPERFADSDETLVTLDSRIAPHFLKKTLYYQKFMVPYNHRYVVDMFFRQDGKIIAGISILREEAMGNFSREELQLLQKIQPFIEFSLNVIYMPQRDQERKSIATKYTLTDRELDVLECVLRGSGNKDIASLLSLGLATVKTHLHHIFRKTGVRARSELVAKVMSDLNR